MHVKVRKDVQNSTSGKPWKRIGLKIDHMQVQNWKGPGVQDREYVWKTNDLIMIFTFQVVVIRSQTSEKEQACCPALKVSFPFVFTHKHINMLSQRFSFTYDVL